MRQIFKIYAQRILTSCMAKTLTTSTVQQSWAGEALIPCAAAPQLPVLALKPNRLTVSKSTADLRIWKETSVSYHRASEFGHDPIVKLAGPVTVLQTQEVGVNRAKQ